MDNNRKSLYNWSRFLLIFALIDAARILANILLDVLPQSKEILSYPNETVRDVALIVVGAVAALLAVAIALQIFAAIRGIAVSKDPHLGTAHITVARIVGVWNILLAVAMVSTLPQSRDLVWDLIHTAMCAVDAAILFVFANTAKKVRSELLARIAKL